MYGRDESEHEFGEESASKMGSQAQLDEHEREERRKNKAEVKARRLAAKQRAERNQMTLLHYDPETT